jgi:hypothetical protein
VKIFTPAVTSKVELINLGTGAHAGSCLHARPDGH